MRAGIANRIREAGLFSLSDIDSSDSTVTYLGYLNSSGGWYILKTDGNYFRYAYGDSNYPSSWTGRTSLTYDTYDNVF